MQRLVAVNATRSSPLPISPHRSHPAAAMLTGLEAVEASASQGKTMDRIFNTRSKPRPRRKMKMGDVLTHQNTLRVYRASPEDVILQIRRVSDYVSLPLTFAEARDVAAALLEACGAIEKA